MKKIDIEKWALDVIERVVNSQPVEDQFVELKREWIEFEKAARQIAGHANAARGHDVLWLIGVDEKSGVIGAELEELANWFGQVKNQFEGQVYPDLTPMNISHDGQTVVALNFETDRAPYVVKNPKYGEKGCVIKQYVPWREGNSTSSARRNDLIKLLVPLRKKPKLVFNKVTLSFRRNNNKPGQDLWIFTGNGYLELTEPADLVINFGEVKTIVKAVNYEEIVLPVFNLRTSSPSIEQGQNEIIVSNSGRLLFDSRRSLPSSPEPGSGPARVKISMRPAGWDSPFVEVIDIPQADDPHGDDIRTWVFERLQNYQMFK